MKQDFLKQFFCLSYFVLLAYAYNSFFNVADSLQKNHPKFLQ